MASMELLTTQHDSDKQSLFVNDEFRKLGVPFRNKDSRSYSWKAGALLLLSTRLGGHERHIWQITIRFHICMQLPVVNFASTSRFTATQAVREQERNNTPNPYELSSTCGNVSSVERLTLTMGHKQDEIAYKLFVVAFFERLPLHASSVCRLRLSQYTRRVQRISAIHSFLLGNFFNMQKLECRTLYLAFLIFSCALTTPGECRDVSRSQKRSMLSEENFL